MLMDPKNLISEELRSLFVKGKPLIHKAVFERNYAALSMMTEEQLMLLKNKLPPCVKHVLGAVDKTGLGDLTFNDLHYQILIPYFRQTGMSAEEAADVCSDFFNEFTGSTRYTDAGARRQHFLEMWPQARDYELSLIHI